MIAIAVRTVMAIIRIMNLVVSWSNIMRNHDDVFLCADFDGLWAWAMRLKYWGHMKLVKVSGRLPQIRNTNNLPKTLKISGMLSNPQITM